MRIYLAGIPKRYHRLNGLKYKVLFSYFTIIFPTQKWGAKSDFRYYTNENISGSGRTT
jgi:hypothetical protein